MPPTVQVTTRYPGASATTLVNTVALPIEQNVNGVENMIYMQSTSASDGTYTLTVTFAIGTDPDEDEILVQNRVSAALSSLPQEVQLQGVTTKKKSTSILEFVVLTSPDSRFDSLFLSNYAVINVQDELRRLHGVGDVTVLGAGQYAMRIWLDPNLLQARGLTPQDVINIIQQQSQEVAAGQIGAPPAPKGQDFQYTLEPQRPPRRSAGVREHHRQGRFGERRPHNQGARRGARRARRADLQPIVQSRRPARRRHRGLAPARRQRDCGLQRGPGENGRARQEPSRKGSTMSCPTTRRNS